MAGLSWQHRAPDLAAWALAQLANRRDVWGLYDPWTDPSGGKHQIRTAPWRGERGQRRLETADLIAHFRGECRAIMGLHSTAPDNTSRWGAVDVDLHDDTPAVATTQAENFAVALALSEAFHDRGLSVLVEDSNGAGGFHVWALFDAPVPTADVFALLQAIVATVSLPCESFPKQASIGSGFGNWLRLPGRHHTRPHWSRFLADSGDWLDGAAAVDALLTAQVNSASLVPVAPPPPAPTMTYTPPPVRPLVLAGALEQRIAAYLTKVPRRAAGQNRNEAGYTLACFLVRDLELSDADALPWLEQWNAGNAPPYPDAKLRELVRDARQYGQRPIGAGMTSHESMRVGRNPWARLSPARAPGWTTA
jgi:hypothetical protein